MQNNFFHPTKKKVYFNFLKPYCNFALFDPLPKPPLHTILFPSVRRFLYQYAMNI